MSAIYPDLKDRVVFVTGGASGIGAALVRQFAAQGARVAFVDLDADSGAALAAETGAWFKVCDVTDVEALQSTLRTAVRDHEALDVLVNNVANDTRHRATELTAESWRMALAVNLDAAMVAAQTAHEAMSPVRRGAIINFSSINALLAPQGMAAYVAAKAAVLGLTKALAREWGEENIRVNAISPGWVATERQLALWLTPEAEAEWMKDVALKRRIMPEDVARLALFLASDESALITGQNFVIDGGRT